jgi:hypothetical protein
VMDPSLLSMNDRVDSKSEIPHLRTQMGVTAQTGNTRVGFASSPATFTAHSAASK